MTSSGTPLPIPRLRLSRQSQKYDDGLDDTPQAGPSRLSPDGHYNAADTSNHDNDGADDAQSTPKIPILKSMSPEPTSAQNAIPPTDTPAARLRALLSRVPNSPPRVSPYVHSPEPDSDFDPPRSSPTNTPSIVRDSLKDLFSHALRDPGDTPQKNRRRNTIDVSDTESSPRVEQERAKNKGKRRSLSDEEADIPSRAGTSLRSSQATTFDALRARLTNSQTQLLNEHAPFDDYTSVEPSSNTPFLRHFKKSPATPPTATSTPPRSMQFPSEFQSNLLEQDLDMQNAMKDFDSFEEDSGPSQHPVSFPPAATPHAVPGRPLAHTSGSKVHSARVHSVRPSSHTRQGSADLTDVSRASPSPSQGDLNKYEREEELNREREREWNKPHPHPKTPELRHRHYSQGSNSSGRSASPMLNLTNGLGSVTSLKSLDDGRSSRTSSFGSQAEYRERINELEKERNAEREREWNKRHPTTSRPTSSLSIHSRSPRRPERTRTQSHPARPDSSTFHSTPDHLHQQRSFKSARSGSPSSSVQSQESGNERELEATRGIDHGRERNWNAPRPKWDPNGPHHHGRSVSPLPSSLYADSHFHSLHTGSLRGDSSARSLHTEKTTLRPSSSNSSLNMKDRPSPGPPSPLPRLVGGNQPRSGRHQVSHSSRSRSPPPHLSHADANTSTKQKENGSASNSPATGSRFGWQFPRRKKPLPPLEFDLHSPEGHARPLHSRALSSPSLTPGSRPSSRVSGSVKASHIPVRSPHLSENNAGISSEVKKHKRSTTELSAPVGGIPPQITSAMVPFTEEDNTHQESVLASDEELPSPPNTSLSTLRPVSSADHSVSPPGSPPREPFKNDEGRRQKAITHSSSFDRSLPTSWPPPPADPSLFLTTPPRRQASSSTNVEFETPPPKGLPELPGPPASEEDEGDAETDSPPARLDGGSHLDFSSMKTPKPPGAWSSTPLPSRRDPLVRSHTLPDFDGFGESTSEGGLATPVASLSRASSLPAQTPAPPGAWLPTPSSDRRRSVLKVRFDVESEQSASDIPVNGHAYAEDTDGSQPRSPGEGSFEVSTPKANTIGLPPSVEVKEEEVDLPVTPRSTPPPSLRKSPSIRVVDAFGRERMPSNEDNFVHDSAPASPVPNTPRNKGVVRIVDAMGRGVEEMNTGEGDIILGHNEALRHVRQSIADLATGLNDADSSGNELEFDDKRMGELNDVSRAARDTRHKLAQTLRMARNAEDDFRNKYGSLRASMRKSKLLPAIITDSRLPWTQNNALIICGVVFVQVLLIVIMYRVSTARAKDIFLNTYYDPYYPDLHLYVTKPDTFRLSMSYTSHWSIFSVPDTLRRGGWQAVVSEAWNGLSMAVWDWQSQTWDNWGATETVPWPPT